MAKPNESLEEHIENCLKVFNSIKQSYPSIPKIIKRETFWDEIFTALYLHDFGKATSGFQSYLYKDNSYWKYRHEIISTCFVPFIKLEDTQSELAVALGVITHHKDLKYLQKKYSTSNPLRLQKFREKLEELKPNYEELVKIMENISDASTRYLGKEIIPSTIPDFGSLKDPYSKFILPFAKKERRGNFTELHQKYGIFIKGFVTACDHLASAGYYSLLQGIKDFTSLYNFESLTLIQQKARKLNGSAILIGPTGSGKTEAALFWTQANQNTARSKRVYYILPYTASINKMYKRLLRDFENPELIGLQHGKVSYFFYKEFESNSNYNQAARKVKEIQNITKKIYRPYKISTIFQLIKPFFGLKGYEQTISEMASGLVILDEIHVYDPRTTALILEILKILVEEFDLKVLLMSATFPSFLQKIFLEYLNIGKDKILRFPDNELRKYTRHRVNIIDGKIEDHLEVIQQKLSQNMKVLIVCNTICKAQKIFAKFSHIQSKKLLHGQFILRDREQIEKNIDKLDLLVGTQAIEVSLNIDYDVLYTEPAPIDALIQRFGRVNRRGWKDGIIKDVMVFSEGSENDKYIYPNFVQETIAELRSYSVLYEDEIPNIVDQIYQHGYSENEEETLNEVRKSAKLIFENLVAFDNNPDKISAFYKLFESYEVIPLIYKTKYFNEINNKRFYEAIKYTVNISEQKFNSLMNDNKVNEEKGSYFVDIDYKPSLGIVWEDCEFDY